MTSTYSTHMFRSLGAVIVGAVLVTSQASAEEKGGVIKVLNKSSNTIWVTITSQKVNLTEFGKSSSSEDSSSDKTALSQKTAADIAGIGGVSSEASLATEHSETHKRANAKSGKYAWSPFIEAGEAALLPGQDEEFKVNDSTYYLTVKRTKDTYWRMNVPKETKSAKHLIIKDDGYWNPLGEVIQAGDKVTLSFENSDFSLTKPIDSHALYHIANGGRSAVTHVIEAVETGQGPILNEAVVRFKIVKPKYPDKDYLFHGAQDNLYYAEYPNDGASHWQVRMLDPPHQGAKLRSGVKVQLQGIRWDKYMTLVDGGDIQWAKGVVSGEGATWTINKDVPPEPLPK